MGFLLKHFSGNVSALCHL